MQLPNAGYDNQSCPILTDLFNQIDRLRVTQYNIYSDTLLYTNVLILHRSGGVMACDA